MNTSQENIPTPKGGWHPQSPIPLKKTGATKKLKTNSVDDLSKSMDKLQLKPLEKQQNQPVEISIDTVKSPIYPILGKGSRDQKERKYKFKKNKNEECPHIGPGKICLNGIHCTYVHDLTKINPHLYLDYLVGSISEIKADLNNISRSQSLLIDGVNSLLLNKGNNPVYRSRSRTQLRTHYRSSSRNNDERKLHNRNKMYHNQHDEEKRKPDKY